MGKTNNSVAPEIKLIAKFYTWSGDDNTVKFDEGRLERIGENYALTSPAREALTSGDDRHRVTFNRLVLYPDGAASIPLVIDVLPGLQNSQIKVKKDSRKAEITFAVRSVIYRHSDREAVVFKIDLQFNGSRDYKEFSSEDLQNEQLIHEYNHTLSDILAGQALILDAPNERIKLGETLGLKLVETNRGSLSFVFRSLPRPAPLPPKNFFAVKFDGVFGNDESAMGQVLRGFNTSFITNRYNRGRIKDHTQFPDADELINFDREKPQQLRLSLHQTAADELSPDAPPKRRAAWVVLLDGVPDANAVNVWNEVARGFHTSLRTIRAGNKVTFLPTLSSLRNASSPTWTAGYLLRDAIDTADPDYVVEGNKSCDPCKNEDANKSECTDPTQRAAKMARCAKYTAFSIWPQTNGKIQAIFPGASDEARKPLSAIISVAKLNEATFLGFQKNPTLKLNLLEALVLDKTSPIRLGAVDFKLGDKHEIPEAEREGENFFQIEIKRDLVGPFFDDERFEIPALPDQAKVTPAEARVLNIKLKAYVINIDDVQPGGQDAPAGNEFLDPTRVPTKDADAEEAARAFNRSVPVIVPWRGKSTADIGHLFLVIHEESDPDHTDSLLIHLRNVKLVEATTDQVQKLIIIDPDPFSIVAVRFPPFNSQGIRNQSNLIGFWLNGPNGARWQLQSLSEDFSLVLPPQILGEEMQKHHTLLPGKAINFRLSQPTTIGINQSEFPQNFREPPWNLRRILEPEGAQAAGVKITFMQYELLYGLSCTLKTRETNIKNLRLMEIFRRFGRIPGPVNKLVDDHKSADEDPVKAWRLLFRQYRARIGVFTPWEPSNEQSLILNEGVQCVIRRRLDGDNPHDGANWAHPLEPGDFGPPVNHQYGQLRGGTTWGFESRNVFTAVTRPNPNTGRIESNTARLVDPQFSSLGGWGHVKATFDNNRSAIYGDASMGRTYSYTLERIGRIGCFWNRAKHVIVYERHVAPSRQFVCTQEVDDKLTGLPLLRKTSEYVEILEPSRTYPENPLAPRMQRGFVNGCYFTEGQRINVDSQWGSDIGDFGWKVPLWNPTARRDVYPKPVFTIGLESDAADKDNDAKCLSACDNPENVFFYTNTEPGLDADTNKWPAVEGLDYVDIPLPVPAAGEYPNGNLIPVFAADPPVAPGFSPCTFRIVKPPSPINIVAERAEKPMSTLLQNVSLMRAGARQLTERALEANDTFTRLHQLNRAVGEVYAEVFKKLPQTSAEELQHVKDRLKNAVTSQSDKIKKIKSDLDQAKHDVDAFIARFVARVKDRENQILDTMQLRLKSFVEDMRVDYKSIIDNLVQSTGEQPNLKEKVAEALRRMFQKSGDTLFMVPLSSNILLRAITPLLEGAANLKKTYDEGYKELQHTVEGLGNIGQAERRRLLEMIDQKDPQVRTLILSLRNVFENVRSQVPESWIPDPKEARDLIKAALDVLDAYDQRLNDLREAVRQFDKATILNRIDATLALTRTELATAIARLAPLAEDKIRDEIRKRLQTWVSVEAYCKCQDRIAEAGNNAEALRKSVDRINEILSDTEVAARVVEFKQILKDHEADINALAAMYTKHLLSDIERLLQQL